MDVDLGEDVVGQFRHSSGYSRHVTSANYLPPILLCNKYIAKIKETVLFPSKGSSEGRGEPPLQYDLKRHQIPIEIQEGHSCDTGERNPLTSLLEVGWLIRKRDPDLGDTLCPPGSLT